MPFYIESEFINLNLTQLSRSIIEQDAAIFSMSKKVDFSLGKLINKVLSNITIEDFSWISNDYISMRDKGSYFKIRLNNKTLHFLSTLCECLDESLSASFENSIPLLIKCIFESYTRLIFADRERLVLKDFLIAIDNAIKKHQQIKLTLYNTETTWLSPLSVNLAKEGSFSYLVGLDTNRSLKTIRISRISQLLSMKKALVPTKDERMEIDKRLAKYGPTFASQNTQLIKVRLSPKGVQKYEYSVIHRPIHTCIEDDNIYVFECSEMQALYFFFRFAGEAEILEPASLRNKFKDLYAAGNAIYE